MVSEKCRKKNKIMIVFAGNEQLYRITILIQCIGTQPHKKTVSYTCIGTQPHKTEGSDITVIFYS